MHVKKQFSRVVSHNLTCIGKTKDTSYRGLLNKYIYYTDTDKVPGFFVLLKSHIFVARSEDTIFIFHV